MTELLNKHVININHINTNLDISINISDTIPDISFDKTQIDTINYYKNMINEVKNIKVWDFCKKLSNNYELLHYYVKNKNINLGIANYDPISRSFFKLWEMIIDFDLIDINNNNMVYGALAEGPGGFIEAFNYYRRKYCNNAHDTVNCITLKPYSSQIPGWNKSNRLFKECNNYNISWGADDTGNLYNIDNILHFTSTFKEKADFVTADGGFDFSKNYSSQEQSAIQLIICEITTGFSILKNNGNMIIKVYDMYHAVTIDIIYILAKHFKDVFIVKPYTSRTANSEKYLVCKGFLGINKKNLDKLYCIIKEYDIINNQNKYLTRLIKNEIPEDFKKLINAYNVNLISDQIKAILKALSYSKLKLTNTDLNFIKNEQTIYSLARCSKYDFPINNRCKFLNKNNPYNYIPNF